MKMMLISFKFLCPSEDVKQMILIREVLEIGALHAIRSKDIPMFEGLAFNTSLLRTAQNVLRRFASRISKDVYAHWT
jgi:hypothetical protein